jgi:hypothetical protein
LLHPIGEAIVTARLFVSATAAGRRSAIMTARLFVSATAAARRSAIMTARLFVSAAAAGRRSLLPVLYWMLVCCYQFEAFSLRR